MCKIGYRTYSVVAVANRVLAVAHDKGIEVTNLKLQKLVYFVQGFALAKLEHPLFNEEIQAWTYGPVIPELYHKVKNYGASPIAGTLAADDAIKNDPDADKVIGDVMEKLGHLPAPLLVNLSHRDNSPWAAAWNKERYSRIPLWQMAIYFKDMLEPQPA